MSPTQKPCRATRKPQCTPRLFPHSLVFSAVVALAVPWFTGPTEAASGNPLQFEKGGVGFKAMSNQEIQVPFSNQLSDSNAAANQIRLNGSGVALGDVDGDGQCDVYLCRLEGDNALYKNLGDWLFQDITAHSGTACPNQYSTGCLLADMDGDGDLDLLVNAIGKGTRLFLNDGSGRFNEAHESGLAGNKAAMSLGVADVEGDGDLDLYVTNYRSKTIRSTGLEVLLVNGRRMLKPEDRNTMYITPDGFLREHGEPDDFYLNDGQAHFKSVSWTSGVFLDESSKPLGETPKDWGLSIAFRDVNGDMRPDIYVCNDFWSPDRFWVNIGNGRFQAIERNALPCTSSFSMGVDFTDIDADGHEDFFVLDMLSADHARRIRQASALGTEEWPPGFSDTRPQMERNTLFLNRGDFTFYEVAQMMKVHATEWSWCPVFTDVDLDGFPDLLITNGYSFDTQDADAEERIAAAGPFPPEKVPGKLLMRPRLPLRNLAFRNKAGRGFEDVTDAWGFDHEGISHGMALGDLDNDGDLDVVVNHLNDQAGFYQNLSGAPRVAVRLTGDSRNPYAIGTRLTLKSPNLTQTAKQVSGGRYLSGDDTLVVFSAKDPDSAVLEITWPDGMKRRVQNLAPNHLHHFIKNEIDDVIEPKKPQPPSNPLFSNATDRIRHAGDEILFDDFARQSALPYKISQSGPGIGWMDLNGDGQEDLIIGAGKGSRMAVFGRDETGGWVPMANRLLMRPITRDQTSLIPWVSSGDPVLLTGASNYEDGLDLGSYLKGYKWNDLQLLDLVPGRHSSVGPLAVTDLDGDGDLDLFAGGRCIPGRYPEPASSALFINENGRLIPLENSQNLFDSIGLIQSATWVDLKNDGFPDLVLASEWEAIRIFDNVNGELTDATSLWGMTGKNGLWNSVTSGDFNNDGFMDLVFGNEGLNSIYGTFSPHPVRLYYHDFDANGSTEILEARYLEPIGQWVPLMGLDAIGKSWPGIKILYPTHGAFANATLPDLEHKAGKHIRHLEINKIHSCVYLNTGSELVEKTLPMEAQISPVYGTAVADFDGDGYMDILITQNRFAVHASVSPNVSGRGLLLKGLGNGEFKSLTARESGVEIYGAQKACALNDFDLDGRMDAVITQNMGPTILLHNQSGCPGLQVRMNAGKNNPMGIGCIVQLVRSDGVATPAQDVVGGTGYLSCDSPVLLVHGANVGDQLRILWPGGRVTMKTITQTTGLLELVAGN